MLNPAIGRGVIDINSPLVEHLLQVPVADPGFAISWNRPEDHRALNMASLGVVLALRRVELSANDRRSGPFCNRASARARIEKRG